ncbi:hypothetical protein PYW07_001841 [Mythimna separata]|uniref:Uncharacterized protein n=1 Tax=Mythimna separata TaxID=271217 RepID=A0AAD7YT03_MYTSE|nr:hypothetical protein PYW07_001841 [Mythimna separata]
MDIKMKQENVLLDIVREVCSENKLSDKLKGKVNRIIADCDLSYYSSLHRLSTGDESTATVLGFMHQTAAELTFDEQSEFNQAVLHKIQTKLPAFISELEHLKQSTSSKKPESDVKKELQASIDNKLNNLEEQESEKTELLMEWLNHRLRDVTQFSHDSSEVLTLKTKILDYKSKILHLQILQSIFTETNQSIKAYSEIHKDMKDSIKETEERIKQFRSIIDSDA